MPLSWVAGPTHEWSLKLVSYPARPDRPKGLSRRTGMRQDQDPVSQLDREHSKIASPFENRPTRRNSPNRSMNFPDTWSNQCRALAVRGM